MLTVKVGLYTSPSLWCTPIFPALSLKCFILYFDHQTLILTQQQSNQMISVVILSTVVR